MSSYDRDIADLIRHSGAQGWRYAKTTNGHHQFYAPNRHDIVTMPGTPSDHRGWLNGMADMKRAGYVPPNGGYVAPTLGDALLKRPEQTEQSEGSPVEETKTARGELAGAIRAYMQARPNKAVSADDLAIAVKAKVPTTNRDSIIVQVNGMIARGDIQRVDRGMYIYRVGDGTKDAPPPPTPTPPAPVVAPTPNIGMAEDQLQANINKLQNALAALADIEEVVRTTKGMIDQLIALRKALGG